MLQRVSVFECGWSEGTDHTLQRHEEVGGTSVCVCVCVCVEFINQVTFSCYALVHYLSILIAMLFVCLFQSIDCPLIVCLFVCFSPWYTFPRHFVFAIEVNL